MKTAVFIFGLMLVGCSGDDGLSPENSETSKQESGLTDGGAQSVFNDSQECIDAGGFCTKGNGCKSGHWHDSIVCGGDQGCCLP